MLFNYLQQIQRLVGDENQVVFNIDDLQTYCNLSRQEVAAQGQCVRRLSLVSGSILTVDLTNGGQNYSANPTVTITPPDAPSGFRPYPQGAQATAQASVIGGTITNIGVTFGGGGYFQPQVTITDPTGTGAMATATVTPINATTTGQEVYSFADVPLQGFPGVGQILSVRGVSLIWNTWQYSINWVSYSKYAALLRQYTAAYFGPPVFGCQVGQGVDGTIHLYPYADQEYQMIFDMTCLPSDLQSDQDYEAIPDPWRNAVPYFAAHLALLNRAATVPQYMQLALQYFNPKDGGLFGFHMRRARAFSQPGRVSSWYGRI